MLIHISLTTSTYIVILVLGIYALYKEENSKKDMLIYGILTTLNYIFFVSKLYEHIHNLVLGTVEAYRYLGYSIIDILPYFILINLILYLYVFNLKNIQNGKNVDIPLYIVVFNLIIGLIYMILKHIFINIIYIRQYDSIWNNDSDYALMFLVFVVLITSELNNKNNKKLLTNMLFITSFSLYTYKYREFSTFIIGLALYVTIILFICRLIRAITFMLYGKKVKMPIFFFTIYFFGFIWSIIFVICIGIHTNIMGIFMALAHIIEIVLDLFIK